MKETSLQLPAQAPLQTCAVTLPVYWEHTEAKRNHLQIAQPLRNKPAQQPECHTSYVMS